MFMGGGRAGDHEHENDDAAAKLGNDTSESFGVTVNKLDKVLTDPSFWGQVHMVCGLMKWGSWEIGQGRSGRSDFSVSLSLSVV